MDTYYSRCLSVLVVLFSVFFISTSSRALDLVVTLGGDTNTVGELRDAIMQINAAMEPVNTITLATDVTLTMGDLVITENLVINGAGFTVTQNTGGSRVFDTLDNTGGGNALTIQFNDITITGGDIVLDGGGVRNLGHNMTFNCATVTGNMTQGDGGGIYSIGDEGFLVIIDSTISSNDAGDGAGFFVDDHTVRVFRSTIYDNDALNDGGGAYVGDQAGPNNLFQNSTFVMNTAERNGGGMFLDADINLFFLTICENTAMLGGGGNGGGLFSNESTDLINTWNILLINNILSGGAESNCFGLTANDFETDVSRSDDDTCFFDGAMAPITELDPITGVDTMLSNDGGKTMVKAVQATSNIADIGTDCLPIDQNNAARQQPFCTVGADEAPHTSTQIIISKNTVPDSATTFPFTSGFTAAAGITCSGSTTVAADGSFSLSDGQSVTCSVTPGMYTITETDTMDHTLTISCMSPDPPNDVDVNGNSVKVTIAQGETIGCTFTNTDNSADTGTSDSGTATVGTDSGTSDGGDDKEVCYPPNNSESQVAQFLNSLIILCDRFISADDGTTIEVILEFFNGLIPTKSAGSVDLSNLQTLNNVTIDVFEEEGLNITDVFLEPDIGTCEQVVENDPFPLEVKGDLAWSCDIPTIVDPSSFDLVLDIFISGVETQEPQGERTVRYEIRVAGDPNPIIVIQTIRVNDEDTGCSIARVGTRNLSFFAVMALIPGFILLRRLRRKTVNR